MIRKLSCLTICLFLFTTFSLRPALATQATHIQTTDTFFSFFENYILAFNAIDKYNKQILAAHTKTQITQPTPTQTTLQPTQTTVQPTQSTIQPTKSTQHTITPPSDVSAYILQGVNDYRASLGLSSVQSSTETCDFAAIRAQEITTNFNHDGFYNRVNNHTIPYSSWTRAVENIAETPDYKNVVTLWKNSPEHAANMRDNTPFVCIMQNGNYYAYEGMRP